MDLDHYLDQRLRAANRVPTGAISTNTLSERLDAVGAKITALDPTFEAPSRSRSRIRASRRTVVVSSAIGVLALASAAAATILSTYTGQSTSGWFAKAVGSGQELRVGVPGYCQAVLSTTSSIPPPPMRWKTLPNQRECMRRVNSTSNLSKWRRRFGSWRTNCGT
jgi:hypothetical protein